MLDVVVPFLAPLGGFPRAFVTEEVWSAPWLQPNAPDDQNMSTIPHPAHMSLSSIFECQQDVLVCALGMVCNLCVPGHRKHTDTRIMNSTKKRKWWFGQCNICRGKKPFSRKHIRSAGHRERCK